jgi:hypothetical protein
MPDRFDFDHLGAEVRCIWCGDGGGTWAWPEEARAEHYHLHDPSPEDEAEQLRIEREYAAADRRARRHGTTWWTSTHGPRTCANTYCSETFVPVRITRIYCSDRCRRAVARRRGGA